MYCGKSIGMERMPTNAREEFTLPYDVVLNLLVGYKGKKHVITINYSFTSIGLFKSILKKRIYAMTTLCANRMGIPQFLMDT